MKVVTILIPSLHGLGVRQKCLGVYSLPFASVTRKKKRKQKKEKPAFLESRSSLSINQFSYLHMLFSHISVPNFPIRLTILRKLRRTWQNAVFEKKPFFIKLNLQKFSSTNYWLKHFNSLLYKSSIFLQLFYPSYVFSKQRLNNNNHNHNIFQQNEHLRSKYYYNYDNNMGPDLILTYYSTDIFSPFEQRHASFLNLRTRILISLSECRQGLAEVDLVFIQTSFLFLWKLCNLRSGSVFVSLCK